MRIAITSRIFEPEPAAASFRLAALANAFADAGHEVTVLSVLPPKGVPADDANRNYRVRRFPVLRDSTGYVRGYAQYMSFDIPLFFRILFGAKRDLIVTEPPPTTGFFVRLAAAIRRVPYAYYAADIWSDAAESTGASGFVVSVVRRMERFALSGARGVLAVNDGVRARVHEIAPRAVVHTVGNGVDTSVFSAVGETRGAGRYLIYSGTASEWQGAVIFIDALERVRTTHPDVRLVFLGQGSDWPALRTRAAQLPEDAVRFIPTVPPAEAAAWMRGAIASVASIKPDAGYDFAFPTKVFASWAAGTPVLYSGEGPVRSFMADHSGQTYLGEGCAYDVDAVTAAMSRVLEVQADVTGSAQRHELAGWAAANVDLSAVARRAADALGLGAGTSNLDGARSESRSGGLNLLIYPGALLGPGRVGKIGRSLQATGYFSETQIVGIGDGKLPASEELGRQVRIVRVRGAGLRDVLGGVRIMLIWPLRVYLTYRKQKISAVAAQNVYMLPLAYRLSRRTGAVFAYNAHELETETIGAVGAKKKIVKFLERRYIFKADVVSVVNDSIAEWYSEHYPGIKPVVVTNVPVDNGESVALREQLEIPEGELLFIHVGYMAPARNIPLILETFAKNPHAHVVFLGDGVLRPEVELAAAKSANIHVLPMVSPDQVVSRVRGADVGLNLIESSSLSYQLSTPNKMMEAIAAGVPPLSSDLYEARRLLGEELSKVWVLKSPAEELAEALARISRADIERFQELRPTLPTWNSQVQALVKAYGIALANVGENDAS